ncbi:MAG: DVUA0089 family protein [Bryobacteraceae bacterium]
MFTLIGGAVRRHSRPLIAQTILAAAVFLAGPARLAANVIFLSGNLRTDATVTSCGAGCTLGPSNTDGDYAQFAAVVDDFTVYTPTTMEAITYGYGGGTSLTGPVVPAGGLEPYLSLFNSSGQFLASTFYGTTCPPGANSVGGNCFDVSLNGGTLGPGTYQIALTAWENMSLVENGAGTNLSDGFTGLGNLAPGENLNYAFDVILPNNTLPLGTPEPASLGLFAMGCVALAFLKRKTS